MAEPALLYEKRAGIAYITFNRPQVRKLYDMGANPVLLLVSTMW